VARPRNVHGEHDAQVAERVHRRVPVIGDHRRREEARELESAVAVRRAHHGYLDALVAESGDAPCPFSFDRGLRFELEAELEEELDLRREVIDDNAYVSMRRAVIRSRVSLVMRTLATRGRRPSFTEACGQLPIGGEELVKSRGRIAALDSIQVRGKVFDVNPDRSPVRRATAAGLPARTAASSGRGTRHRRLRPAGRRSPVTRGTQRSSAMLGSAVSSRTPNRVETGSAPRTHRLRSHPASRESADRIV
jgi:hypothetical protein